MSITALIVSSGMHAMRIVARATSVSLAGGVASLEQEISARDC